MIRITKAEQKAIFKEYPSAIIISCKYHSYLGGYDTAAPAKLLYALRGYDPTQHRKPKRKDSRPTRKG